MTKRRRAFEKAADLGDPEAMNNFANMHRDTNPEEAVRLYRRAAEAGLAPAMVNLGALAHPYEGLSRTTWKRETVPQGRRARQRPGMNARKPFAEFGTVGAVDFAEAQRWYQKAAELGGSNGMTSLADFYVNGKGVEQNYDEGVRLYKSAVELGTVGRCTAWASSISRAKASRRTMPKRGVCSSNRLTCKTFSR